LRLPEYHLGFSLGLIGRVRTANRGGTKIVGIGITAIAANRSGLPETYIARAHVGRNQPSKDRDLPGASDIAPQENVSFQGKAAVTQTATATSQFDPKRHRSLLTNLN
jgi:hypothetical protein